MPSLLLLTLLAAAAPAAATFRLPDGVDMAYLDRGRGEPALVFVHCGNCRKEIWTETLAAFEGEHRVVAMDLPGHGRSGARRAPSLPSFGADVAALMDHLKLGRVVLVGNSLGGPVSLEAARRLGKERVLGVVVVDTLHDVERRWPADALRKTLDAYRADFRNGCQDLMLGLLADTATASTRERIRSETCANDPVAAIALLETFRDYVPAAALRAAGVPVWAIQGSRFPTAVEVNRKHAPSFQAIVMEGTGHFPQVESPAAFQGHVRRVVRELRAAGSR
jgi:pimeloyl-ACP methyl ester carboxylesterase